MNSILRILVVVAALCSQTLAFAPSTSKAFVSKTLNGNTFNNVLQHQIASQDKPVSLKKQRHSMAQIQTMVFGLGGPEIAIILIAAAFLLGPQKLAELGKDAGKIAGELKEVPKEFQAGLEEGEKQAMQTKKDLAGEVKDAETD